MSKQTIGAAPSELEMVQDATALTWAIWRRTDFDNISAARSLDDEFASRIGTAAYTDSVASFLDRLADKWGVRSLPDDQTEVRNVIHRYDGDDGPASARDFLRTVRQNKALVVLEMKHEYQSEGN
jgi:hypothetical protein